MATIKAYDNDPQADMALTVTPSDDNPYYNLFETDADGVLHICKGHGLYTRRQDVPKVFRINGAVYVIRPSFGQFGAVRVMSTVSCPSSATSMRYTSPRL